MQYIIRKPGSTNEVLAYRRDWDMFHWTTDEAKAERFKATEALRQAEYFEGIPNICHDVVRKPRRTLLIIG